MRTVIQVTPHYPPFLGGLERVVEILARGLAADNEVRVLSTTVGARGAARRATQDGVAVRRHRAVSVAHTAIAPGLVSSLLRLPRGSVVHLHSSQMLTPELVWLCCRLRRLPYFVHFHMEVDASGRLGALVLPAYKALLLSRVLRAATGVITLTEEQAGFVQTVYGVEPGQISTIPNGVAPEFFLPERPPRPGELRLLFVGRLGAQKNLGRLLEALSLCEEPVRLRIVGDGELRPQLEAQAVRLGVADLVEFRGRRSGAELVEEYAHAQVFILTSDREGMALAAMEAMAAALPVVATAVPGNRELLDGVGLLAEPEPRALAAAVDQLARDRARRSELAARSVERARGYTWAATVAAVETAYRKAGV